MPGLSDKVLKMFQTSSFIAFLEGNPTPYVASVTLPNIMSEVVEFNNTSTGGKVEFADGFRKAVDGDGEIKFEQDSSDIVSAVTDSSRIQTLILSTAINAYNPQSGVIAPLPQKYTMSVQFSGWNPGEIAIGAKRDVTATFKIFKLKYEIGITEVIDYDFISGKFVNGGVDALTAINALLNS